MQVHGKNETGIIKYEIIQGFGLFLKDIKEFTKFTKLLLATHHGVSLGSGVLCGQTIV